MLVAIRKHDALPHAAETAHFSSKVASLPYYSYFQVVRAPVLSLQEEVIDYSLINPVLRRYVSWILDEKVVHTMFWTLQTRQIEFGAKMS